MVEKEQEELLEIAGKLALIRQRLIDYGSSRYKEEALVPNEYFQDIKVALDVLDTVLEYDILDCIGIKEDKEKVKWFIATHKNLD